MALTSISAPGLILWDVIEEHLDEAEFLFERWNRAFFLPGYTLHALGRTFESRLLAHIDALVVGGSEVARRFLLPQLVSAESPARATAAALALLAEPEGVWEHAVIEAMQKAKPPLQAALSRALILTDSARLDARVEKSFSADPENPSLLQVLTGRGIDPGFALRAAVESNDPALSAAARNAVRRFGRRELYYLAKVDSLFGSTPAFEESVTQLGSPETIESALWNLGFCGTAEAGDLCVSYLAHSNVRLRKLATDSIAWIGGFNPADSHFRLSPKDVAEKEPNSLPAFDEDDLGANLELEGVDALPIPNADAVTQWWRRNRDRLAGYGRSVLGRSFSPDGVIAALRHGPLWRRHALADELRAGTHGKQHVSTDAFSSRQIRQIAALAV